MLVMIVILLFCVGMWCVFYVCMFVFIGVVGWLWYVIVILSGVMIVWVDGVDKWGN